MQEENELCGVLRVGFCSFQVEIGFEQPQVFAGFVSFQYGLVSTISFCRNEKEIVLKKPIK